jgi:UDP-glucose:(heptosyl)LPS alpha-1,3-glucosyltransferase
LKPLLEKGGYDLVVGFDKMPGLDLYYAADPCYRARTAGSRSWPYVFTGRYRHFAVFEAAVFDPSGHTEILTVSEEEQKNYEYYYGIPSERFHYLPPGISRDFIPPHDIDEKRASLRRELFSDPNKIIALFVGSNFKLKGLDRVLQAMAMLSPSERDVLQVHVVGQDKARPFERMAKKLGLSDHVYFWGAQDTVVRFFWAADFLTHPAYRENTGNVLLESLVSGLPVITTDVCGYAYHIQDARAGMVIASPFTVKALVAGLKHMLVSKKRTVFAQNARKYAAVNDLHSRPEQAADIIERCGHRNVNGEYKT